MSEQEQTMWLKIKKLLAPIGVGVMVCLKFLAKLKFVIIPIIKFVPVFLKTGGTMILSIGVYALIWGWKFAVGFVLLMMVHECGHLLVAKKLGLTVSAPMFIPFMGAFIALKDQPKDAWVEARVGFGGPLLGTLGALACWCLYLLTGNKLFSALAFSGFFLNLFNLMPVGFLDGGRIVSAISLWLWVVGMAISVFMLVMSPNLLLLVIMLMSLPHMWKAYKNRKTPYYEVTKARRLLMSVAYFGLVALLVFCMAMTYVDAHHGG